MIGGKSFGGITASGIGDRKIYDKGEVVHLEKIVIKGSSWKFEAVCE